MEKRDRKNAPNKKVKPPTVNAAGECTVEGCGRPVRAKGLCGRHYNAAREKRPLRVD